MTDEERITAGIRRTQIVILSQIACVIALAAIAWVLGGNRLDEPKLTQIMLMILALLALGLIPAYAAVRASIFRRLRTEYAGTATEAAAPGLVQAHFTLSVIGAGMAESVGLFAGIVFLMTGAPPALLGAGASVVVLSSLIPTRERFDRFAERVASPEFR